MLCEGCGKREATAIRGGEKRDGGHWTMHLCDACAPKDLDRELTEEEAQQLIAELRLAPERLVDEQLAELKKRFEIK